MARRPGFVSARLYPAGGGADPREYIQVAHWSNAGLLASAQADPEIERVRAEVMELVAFVRRVLCDAPIEDLAPLADLRLDRMPSQQVTMPLGVGPLPDRATG